MSRISEIEKGENEHSFAVCGAATLVSVFGIAESVLHGLAVLRKVLPIAPTSDCSEISCLEPQSSFTS